MIEESGRRAVPELRPSLVLSDGHCRLQLLPLLLETQAREQCSGCWAQLVLTGRPRRCQVLPLRSENAGTCAGLWFEGVTVAVARLAGLEATHRDQDRGAAVKKISGGPVLQLLRAHIVLLDRKRSFQVLPFLLRRTWAGGQCHGCTGLPCSLEAVSRAGFQSCQ